MDAPELDDCIPQMDEENIFSEDLAMIENILHFGDEAIEIDQSFKEIQNTASSLIDQQTIKGNLQSTPLYTSIPNICFNSFIVDESKFASTFYVENIFPTTHAVIQDESLAQSDQINLIRAVLNNIIDNVLIKCEENEQLINKTNQNFLQVFPLNNWKLRRTSSLKQLNSTDDASNTTKKIVRFADSLGLDLIDVRTYMDEMPNIPLSAFQDLTKANCSKDKLWVPLFEPPERLANFNERLSRNFVCLQSTTLKDNWLNGKITVQNIGYQKIVQIRCTRNNWKTYIDCNCSFAESSCDGSFDTFQFNVDVGDKWQVDSKIEFAVKFRCMNHEFWDNNFGRNYAFECVPAASRSIEHDSEITDLCSSACIFNNSEDLVDAQLTHTLVQNYMSKLLQLESVNQQTYQKQIRNSERTLEVFVITGILIMCAVFLYIEKVIYFV